MSTCILIHDHFRKKNTHPWLVRLLVVVKCYQKACQVHPSITRINALPAAEKVWKGKSNLNVNRKLSRICGSQSESGMEETIIIFSNASSYLPMATTELEGFNFSAAQVRNPEQIWNVTWIAFRKHKNKNSFRIFIEAIFSYHYGVCKIHKQSNMLVLHHVRHI